MDKIKKRYIYATDLLIIMKKFFLFLAISFSLVVFTIFVYYNYLMNSFVYFEPETEEVEFVEISAPDGFRFLDLNQNGKLDIYEDKRADLSARVEDALNQMTTEEKLHLLKGSGIGSAMGVSDGPIPGAVGTIVSTPRLGLPEIYLSDGPAGLRIQPFREGDTATYYATAFPIATALSSTWNTNLVNQVGQAMGDEAKAYGIDIILGPGANLMRHPLTGRNFEYYSEDPLLSGKMASAMITGIQSKGIGTSLKHFVANNQETNRNLNNSMVSQRALREIYLKGFEIPIREAKPWTIMTSYNMLNGVYTSESKELLTDILREEWGFQGAVMTDWYGGKDVVAQIRAGNDLIEPGTLNDWENLINAQKKGDLTEETIHTAARNVLTLVFKSGKVDSSDYSNTPNLLEHARITRESASEGMVLLKNDNRVLPLQQGSRVGLFGVNSFQFISGGTGSGDVNEAYTISLEEGLQNSGIQIHKLSKLIYEAQKSANPEAFEAPTGPLAIFNPFNPPQLTYSRADIEQMVKNTDAAVFTLGRNSGEGGDRKKKDDFSISEQEIELMTMVSEVYQAKNKPFIVVLNIGGVIETSSWKSMPDAIVLAWQGGQEGGNAVGDIMTGKVNPSGKLPMTFSKKLEDHRSDAYFPKAVEPNVFEFLTSRDIKPVKEQVPNIDYTEYEEGIFVGYRHFDSAEIDVSYPFGYGLSFTEFQIENPNLTKNDSTITFDFTVLNTGKHPGKEVFQVYSSLEESQVVRPVKELRSFAKTNRIKPGQTQDISIVFSIEDLAYFEESEDAWKLEKGTYTLHLGTSSRDIIHTFYLSID